MNKKQKRPTILIGIPCHSMVASSFAQSLSSALTHMCNRGYKVTVQFFEGTLVHTARKMLVESALEKNVDYLFFVDSDMIIHPETVDYLLATKVDIVSTMFFKRVHPYQPCFYTGIEFENGKPKLYTPIVWNENCLYECAATGLAATLISRKVLEALKDTEMFLCPYPELGEDVAFCMNAREAGFEIYVHTGLVAGHIGKVVVTDKTFKEVNCK